MHHIAAKDKNDRRKKETYDKRHGDSVKFLIFYVPGKNYPPVGHKRTDRKMPQLLRRGQGQTGVEAGNLKKKDKNGQIGPIGYKGLEIYRVYIVQVDKKEPGTEGEHGPQNIRYDKGGGGKGGACAVVSAAIPVCIFGKGH
jgi:hypothetical protein